MGLDDVKDGFCHDVNKKRNEVHYEILWLCIASKF